MTVSKKEGERPCPTRKSIQQETPGLHRLPRPRRQEGDKGFWTRIGVAWAHKDGKGFDVQLDGLAPLDGRIVLRMPEPKNS